MPFKKVKGPSNHCWVQPTHSGNVDSPAVRAQNELLRLGANNRITPSLGRCGHGLLGKQIPPGSLCLMQHRLFYCSGFGIPAWG